MISSPYMFITFNRNNKCVHTPVTLILNIHTPVNPVKHGVFGVIDDANLVVEPVLICQRQQIVQSQRVFLVDHLKRPDGLLEDRSSVAGNLREDCVFPEQTQTGNAQKAPTYSLPQQQNSDLPVT